MCDSPALKAVPNRPASLGERLREARLAAGMSQTDLSARSGLPKPTLSRYENDHVLPSLSTLRRLATALGVTETALLPGKRSLDTAFLDALHQHGVTFASAAEAERTAELVAEVLKRDVVGRPART
jgi:transcriptional regulator with XRE-family HTH domain